MDAEKGTIGTPIVAFDGEASGPGPAHCTFALLDAGHALCQRGACTAAVPAELSTLPRGPRERSKDPIGRRPVASQAPRRSPSSSPPRGAARASPARSSPSSPSASPSSYRLIGTMFGVEGAPEAPPY